MGSLKNRRKSISFQTLYIVFLKSLLKKKGVWIILLIGIISTVVFQVITSISELDKLVDDFYGAYSKSKVGSNFDSNLFLEKSSSQDGFFYELFRLISVKEAIYVSSRGDVLFTSIIAILGMYLTYFSFVSKKNKGGFLVLLSTNTTKSQLMWANILAILTTSFIVLAIYSGIEIILTNELYRGFLEDSTIRDEIDQSFGYIFYLLRGEELLKNPLSNFEGEMFKPQFLNTGQDVNVPLILFQQNENPFTLEATTKIREIMAASNENITQIMKENITSVFSYANAVTLFFANLGIYFMMMVFIIGLFLLLSTFITSVSLVVVIIQGLITLTSISLPIIAALDVDNKEAIIAVFKIVVPLNSLNDLRTALIFLLNGDFVSSNSDSKEAYSSLFVGTFGGLTLKSLSSSETWIDVRILVGVISSCSIGTFGLMHFLNKRVDWK